MRLPTFRFGRSNAPNPPLQAANPAGDLDTFLSESGVQANAPARRKASRSVPKLLPLVAALAIIEAVPAGLWLYRTFRMSEATAAATPPPDTTAVASPVPVTMPCEPPPLARVESTAPVSSQGTARSRATATGGAATTPATPPRSVGGMLAVTAPVPMHVYSRGRIVGTTEAETIMLPVGSHDLEFVSEETGYKARRTVSVQAGKTATVRLEAPSGTVHANATPWAEVWIDNHKVGETPVGNLHVPIGTREFVFRHPQFGDRRKTALVTLKEPTRISMDMRTK